MSRRAVVIVLAALVAVLATLWLTSGDKGAPKSPSPPVSSLLPETSTPPSPGSASSGHQKAPEISDRAAKRKACGEILARAVMSRGLQIGPVGIYLVSLHRGNPDFKSMADEFCAKAGDDLVPICRELLARCESDSAGWIIAALLGHSRKEEALPLLKELAERSRLAPDRDEYSSAVYSIGMLGSVEGKRYLIQLFSESAGDRRNRSGKFGTPLMAAIGMCGKEGLAILKDAALSGLDPDMKADTDEGLRVFRWGYVSFVDSPAAFDDLKQMATSDPDLRFRGMAIAALGQSSDPAQRRWLADLYAQDKNPLVRRAILESLNDGAENAPGEWADMKDRMAGPLASILSATRLPSGNEYVDYASIHLAASLDTADARHFVEEWIRAASKGAYEAEAYWVDIAIHALAAQKASTERLNSVLDAAGISEEERLYYWANFINHEAKPPAPLSLAREFIDSIDKMARIDMDGYLINRLTALGKFPEAKGDVEACIERMIEKAEPSNRFRAFWAAASAGEASLLPLARAIRTGEEPTHVLDACFAYLVALPEGRPIVSDLDSRIRALFTADSISLMDEPAFARTVGPYFGRFGTLQDLPFLESIPRLAAGANEETRQRLASECRKAADAIRLRSN